jgi:hypothetical protein
LIAAALAALPLIAEAGQGLIKTVGHDVASLFGAGQPAQAGQNVPAPANSTTLSGAAQSLSSGMMSVLTQVQNSLGQIDDFANGQSTLNKTQFENAAIGAANTLGQNPTTAKAAADKVFDQIDTGHTGQITEPQLTSYLSQQQSAATAKYQAASGLGGAFVHDIGALVTAPLSLVA